MSYFNIYKGIALYFIWLTAISIILRYLREVKDLHRIVPQRQNVFREIVCDIDFYIKNRGNTPLGASLAKIRANIVFYTERAESFLYSILL